MKKKSDFKWFWIILKIGMWVLLDVHEMPSLLALTAMLIRLSSTLTSHPLFVFCLNQSNALSHR